MDTECADISIQLPDQGEGRANEGAESPAEKAAEIIRVLLDAPAADYALLRGVTGFLQGNSAQDLYEDYLAVFQDAIAERRFCPEELIALQKEDFEANAPVEDFPAPAAVA